MALSQFHTQAWTYSARFYAWTINTIQQDAGDSLDNDSKLLLLQENSPLKKMTHNDSIPMLFFKMSLGHKCKGKNEQEAVKVV